jgi:membrane protease YdiL (CAAX protease family)
LSIVLVFGILVVLAAVISVWAHRAQNNRFLRIALYLVTFAISGIFLLIGVTSSAENLHRTTGSVSYQSWLLIAVGLAIGLPLLRPVRLALAHVMPFDPNSTADMIGLVILLATAIYFGGTSLEESANVDVSSVGALELVSQSLAFVFIAYVGIGWLINRRLHEATERLGLKAITPRQLWQAAALVIALFAVTILSSALTFALQPSLDKQIQENLGTMTRNLSSFGGALLLGVSAGVGEEVLFRGAVQPRYGIVFTSLVFASLHVQYGISLTILGIFLVSVLLGMERQRVNTTASVVTHVIYDVLAVLIPLLLKGS